VFGLEQKAQERSALERMSMWAWLKECHCFVVPVIQRASSQQLLATPGPGLCLVGLFGCRFEALLTIIMIL